MQKINVLGGVVNLNGDVVPFDQMRVKPNPKFEAARNVQSIIFDKMIDECHVDGLSLEGQIWNELGIQLLFIMDRIKEENA